MQILTKIEMEWAINELNKTAKKLKNHANENCGSIAGLLELRSEQISGIAEKLQNAITDGNKQIRIKY